MDECGGGDNVKVAFHTCGGKTKDRDENEHLTEIPAEKVSGVTHCPVGSRREVGKLVPQIGRK